jgi:Ca2+-binding EF-hand superfamily protein
MKVFVCVALLVAALFVCSGDAARLRNRKNIRLSKDPLKYLMDFIKAHSSKVQAEHAQRQDVADGECTKRVDAKVYIHYAPEWYGSYLHGCDKRSQCFNKTRLFAAEGRKADECIRAAVHAKNSSLEELRQIEATLKDITEEINKAEEDLQTEIETQKERIVEHDQSIAAVKDIIQMMKDHHEKTPDAMPKSASEIIDAALVETSAKPMRKEMRDLVGVLNQLIDSWRRLNVEAQEHVSMAKRFWKKTHGNYTSDMNALRERRDVLEGKNEELEGKVPECKTTLTEMEGKFNAESLYCSKIHKSYVQVYHDNTKMIKLADTIHSILESHVGSRAHAAMKTAAKHARKVAKPVTTAPASTGATGTAATASTGATATAATASTGAAGAAATGATGATSTDATGAKASGATGAPGAIPAGATASANTPAAGAIPAGATASAPTAATASAGATAAPAPGATAAPAATASAPAPTGASEKLFPKAIDKMWNTVLEQIDQDKDGEVSLEEVEKIYVSVPHAAKALLRKYVKEVFTKLDMNKDGKVSSLEMSHFIKRHFLPSSEKKAMAALKKEFKEGEHKHITRTEFSDIMGRFGALDSHKSFNMFKGDDDTVDVHAVSTFSSADEVH